jgi:hypothetical protein
MKKNIIIGDLHWEYIQRRLCPKMEMKLQGTIKNYKQCSVDHITTKEDNGETLESFARNTVWTPLFKFAIENDVNKSDAFPRPWSATLSLRFT